VQNQINPVSYPTGVQLEIRRHCHCRIPPVTNKNKALSIKQEEGYAYVAAYVNRLKILLILNNFEGRTVFKTISSKVNS
jgi:hypothetical protein